MNSPSVKQRTSLMFVTLMCYGSRSQTSQLLHTKETFCSWLQINILASAGEWFHEYEWTCSRVQVNSLAGGDELARGYEWTCSQVRVNLLASRSRASATLHLSGTVCIWVETGLGHLGHILSRSSCSDLVYIIFRSYLDSAFNHMY